MTQDEIIEMARQAGFMGHEDSFYTNHRYGDCRIELEAFAKLVAAKEREECVRRAHIALLGTLESTAGRVIHAIQTRGET
jgi:hypothetical protein